MDRGDGIEIPLELIVRQVRAHEGMPTDLRTWKIIRLDDNQEQDHERRSLEAPSASLRHYIQTNHTAPLDERENLNETNEFTTAAISL